MLIAAMVDDADEYDYEYDYEQNWRIVIGVYFNHHAVADHGSVEQGKASALFLVRTLLIVTGATSNRSTTVASTRSSDCRLTQRGKQICIVLSSRQLTTRAIDDDGDFDPCDNFEVELPTKKEV